MSLNLNPAVNVVKPQPGSKVTPLGPRAASRGAVRACGIKRSSEVMQHHGEQTPIPGPWDGINDSFTQN